MRSLSFAMLFTLLAPPVFAEEISETGWKISCIELGCQIASGGYTLWTTPDSDQGAHAYLEGLPDVSAISFVGDLQNMGDSTADVTLFEVSKIDDKYEGNLQFMQGDWTILDEETPYVVRITGLEWQEWVNEEFSDSFNIVAGDTCADGTSYEGMVLSLYRLGDDPDAEGCWGIEYIDGQTLSLRDLWGDWGVIDYAR